MAEAQSTPRRRPLISWGLSLVGAALLLWLASNKIDLWPQQLVMPRPELWWIAVALHLPYGLIRALRLRYVLDPLVERASGGATKRLSAGLLYGSGLVSFFVVILLPLRLGELSRPLILARAREPGVGLPESIGGIAVERVVDGLVVVGMLFVGLALADPVLSSPEIAERIDYVRWFGQLMAVLFGVGLVALAVAGRAPTRFAGLARGIGGVASPASGDRLASVAERIAAALAPLYRPRCGVPFVSWSLVYWAVTVGQLWLVLHACGLEFDLAQAAAIVAIVGLSIQLPGGPAQAGSFQFGMMAALGLFLPAGPISGAGSSFAALMYLLQLVGAGALALLGLVLLARARPARDVSTGARPR